MFAMLFAITSTLSCWACMPVAAVLRARIYWSPRALAHTRKLVDRSAAKFIRLRDHLRDRGVGPADLDHVRQLLPGVDVRAFDEARRDLAVHRRARFFIRRPPEIVAHFFQPAGRIERRHAQRADLRAVLRDRALLGDRQ